MALLIQELAGSSGTWNPWLNSTIDSHENWAKPICFPNNKNFPRAFASEIRRWEDYPLSNLYRSIWVGWKRWIGAWIKVSIQRHLIQYQIDIDFVTAETELDRAWMIDRYCIFLTVLMEHQRAGISRHGDSEVGRSFKRSELLRLQSTQTVNCLLDPLR